MRYRDLAEWRRRLVLQINVQFETFILYLIFSIHNHVRRWVLISINSLVLFYFNSSCANVVNQVALTWESNCICVAFHYLHVLINWPVHERLVEGNLRSGVFFSGKGKTDTKREEGHLITGETEGTEYGEPFAIKCLSFVVKSGTRSWIP